MARIRTIKPDVCMSRKVARVSIAAQLLWERLWCFCDSEGRLDYHPAVIKGSVFPLIDSISQDDVAAMVSELAEAGLIELYAADGHEYLAVVNWHEHQRPKNESPSKIPPPPGITHFVGTPYGQNADGVPQMSVGEVGSRKKEVGKGKEKSPPEGGQKEKTAKRFSRPTPEEVQAYADEKGYGIDAQRFCAFYDSKGWVVGKSPMKDWQAAVRGWHSRDNPEPKVRPSPLPAFRKSGVITFEQAFGKGETP